LRWYALAGLCTSFGAANELPALGCVAAVAAMLFIHNPLKAVLGYVPALLPVLLGFFGLNYLAHDEWKPAYAHRDVGALLFTMDITPGDNFMSTAEIVRAIEAEGIDCSDQCEIRHARRGRTFEFLDVKNERQLALRVAEDESSVAVHDWGDWYDYPGSYWAGEKSGVDKGEASRPWYIFHCLIGHHGIFSLTPFWLVTFLGVVAIFGERATLNFFRDHRLMLCLAILVTSAVVIGFYFSRSLEDRNYGGVTSGFRWTFWMIPMWLYLATSGLQKLNSQVGRRIVEWLVVLSVFSASFPWNNPWVSPWLMQLFEYFNWIQV
ncbi:MAG: hypothetical protein AAF483_23720, partial [Planctomycetota bacterium]